jgi:hypothetical protein
MHLYYTFNDLALIAYNESDFLDKEEFRNTLNESILSSKSFRKILKLKKYLADKNIGPSESTIRNILNYSQALSVHHTEKAGRFGLVLN